MASITTYFNGTGPGGTRHPITNVDKARLNLAWLKHGPGPASRLESIELEVTAEADDTRHALLVLTPDEADALARDLRVAAARAREEEF